ncbi:MAG: thiamine-phosphate kinase [Dehalococcoidia bacterium]
MKVSELGEFGLIERIREELGAQQTASKALGPRSKLLIGIGDDAALWQSNATAHLATTDTLVAGVHFPREVSGWEDLGWKAMTANISDIAAMGGTPEYALVTLALPADFLVEDVLTLYRGMSAAANEYGVLIAGGDVVRAAEAMISVALTGRASESQRGEPLTLRRDEAKAGDLVAVSGSLGNAAGGLRLILERVPCSPEASAYLRRAQLRPRPHVELGQALLRAGVRCAIDISDGLAQDLRHVCEASAVGAVVRVKDIPVSEHLARTFPGEALAMAVGGGEDYELLFTGAAAVVDRVRSRFATPITVIGSLVEDAERRVRFFDEGGQEVSFASGGWDHFAGGPA